MLGALDFGYHDLKLLQDLLHFELVRITEVQYGVADPVAHLLKQVLVEVVVRELALISSTEAGLASKSVDNAELLPHHHPSSRLFALVSRKSAIFEVEQLCVLVQQAREDSLLYSPVVLPSTVAVAEDVLLSGVAVQIKHKEDLAVILEALDHVLESISCGLHLARRVDPTPVDVHSSQVTAGVSVDDSIWVEHGHDLEDKVVSEDFGVQTGACEIVQNAFHHPRGSGFARMNPRTNDNTFPILNGLRVRLESSDDEHVADVASYGLTELSPPDSVPSLRVLL